MGGEAVEEGEDDDDVEAKDGSWLYQRWEDELLGGGFQGNVSIVQKGQART